jgi:hypothetical protein
MHLTKTHAVWRWGWTYVTGQHEKPTGTARIAKKKETQELRSSARGVTGASWAAF